MDSRVSIVKLANQIISGEITMIAGVRELVQLNEGAPPELDVEVYGIFYEVDNESNALPVDEKTRINWNVDALRVKDLEIKEIEEKWGDSIVLACKAIVRTLA